MKIEGIVNPVNIAGVKKPAAGKANFGEMFSKRLNELNALQKKGETAIADYVNDKASIHEVLLTLEKAEIALRVAVEVRNKIVEAYKEINRL